MKKILLAILLLTSITLTAQVKETVVRMTTWTTPFVEKYGVDQLIRVATDSVIYSLTHGVAIGQNMQTVVSNGWGKKIGKTATSYTGTSPVSVLGAAIGIIPDSLTSWYDKQNKGASAYSWGNWANAGLLTSELAAATFFPFADTTLMPWKLLSSTPGVAALQNDSLNVGIGTSTPHAKLDVVGKNDSNPIASFKTLGGDSMQIYSVNTNVLTDPFPAPRNSIAVSSKFNMALKYEDGARGDTSWGEIVHTDRFGNINWREGSSMKANQAWGWGNHADQGYVKFQPWQQNYSSIYYLSNVGIGISAPQSALDMGLNGVITTSGGTSANWNTAYNWGNHASAGYLTTGVAASTYQTILTNPVTGSGTAGYVPYYSGTTSIGNSGLWWDNANGRLGVGTTSPSYALQISGSLLATSGIFASANITTSGGNLLTNSNSAAQIGNYHTGASSAVAFISKGTERVRIDPSGNLGIGTSTPATLLHVAGTSTLGDIVGGSGADSYLNLKSTSGAGTTTGPALKLSGGTNGGTSIITALNNGNIGFSTTAPTQKLDISGPAIIGTLAFTGSGVNDATLSGTFTNNISQNLRIKITSTGTPDKFDWSIDGGSTWVETGKSIVSGAMTLNYTGISVTFGATTGHTLNDYWQATLTAPTGVVNLTGITIGGNVFAGGFGSNNTSVGIQAFGSAKNTGRYNSAYGYQSLYSNTTGYYNTAIGTQCLYSNTAGNSNTANGMQSLLSNTFGSSNTATGYSSLYNNTTGLYNTANGTLSLYLNTTGYSNTSNGMQSLYSNTIGIYNTAIGYASLYWNTVGSSNVANGNTSLYHNTSGSSNTVNGYSSMYTNATGRYNSTLGYNSQGISPARPTAVTVAGGLVDQGSHQYLVTYVINGIEHPSQWRSVTTTSTDKKVNIASISVYSGPQSITNKRLYRTVVAGGATATCTLSGGTINSITVTAPGSGYGTTAVVTITPKDAGTGAIITCTGITGGAIVTSNMTITNAGSGYTVAPIITISKYPSDDQNKFYKVADIPLANTTYTDSLSDVTIMANGTLPIGMSSSILLGYNSTGTGSGQFVIGDASAPVSDSYFGGVFNSNVSSAGLQHIIHGMGANGTDLAGGDLVIAGGKGTGTGAGGKILFQTAPASTTSSNENSLSTAMTILSTQKVGFGTTNPLAKVSISGGNLQVSQSGGDSVSVSSGNAIRFYGNATVWDDVMGPFSLGTNGGNPYPTYTADSGYYNFLVDTTGASLCKIYMDLQLPHSYKEGSDVYFHVHYKHETTVGTPTFIVKYRWVNIGATPGAYTWKRLTSTTGTTNNTQQLNYGTAVSGTGKTISSLIQAQVYLYSQTGTGNVHAYSFDVHFEKDGVGSNTETSKN